MKNQLDTTIDAIERRVNAKDPEALADAERLAEKHPDEPKVWHFLSYARAMSQDYDGAVAAVTRLMQLMPLHPSMFFNRGRYEFKRDNLLAALSDFTQGLIKCDELEDNYNRTCLYFFRADVLIQLGRKSEARADLAHVRDGFTFWTTTLRTKAEMLAECDR